MKHTHTHTRILSYSKNGVSVVRWLKCTLTNHWHCKPRYLKEGCSRICVHTTVFHFLECLYVTVSTHFNEHLPILSILLSLWLIPHTHILVHATSERSYQQGPLLAQVQPTEATGCHHCWYSPFIGGPHKYVWVAYKLHTKKISYSLPIGNYPHVDSSSSTSGPSSLWLPGSNEPTTKLEIFLTLQFWCPPINSRK